MHNSIWNKKRKSAQKTGRSDTSPNKESHYGINDKLGQEAVNDLLELDSFTLNSEDPYQTQYEPEKKQKQYSNKSEIPQKGKLTKYQSENILNKEQMLKDWVGLSYLNHDHTNKTDIDKYKQNTLTKKNTMGKVKTYLDGHNTLSCDEELKIIREKNMKDSEILMKKGSGVSWKQKKSENHCTYKIGNIFDFIKQKVITNLIHLIPS